MASLFAKVVIDSPLPQLDRPFEYSVPQELATAITVGSRVRVPFGRAANQTDGFVVGLSQNAEFKGELATLSSLVSTLPALAPNIYDLARAVADRQAATLNDVLKLAVPNRSVAVEKRWLENQPSMSVEPVSTTQASLAKKISHLAAPIASNGVPQWCEKFLNMIAEQAAQSRSTIVCLPDFRDLNVFKSALMATDLGPSLIDYSADKTNSKRYASFLQCLEPGPHIVVGNRAAIYAPIQNLGLICVWDDGDSSHVEPTSPYSNTREVALIRQSLEGCSLVFSSHSRSSEIQRLVEIGYLDEKVEQFEPQILATETESRVDGLAWQTIRNALATGPVLVQVASKGFSKSSYCAKCSERAKCHACNGPLWIDAKNQPRCRWCYSTNLNFTCSGCGGRQLRPGKPGATRTIAEFGKAFPGTRIIESNGENPIEWVDDSNCIVVSTPGAEPRAKSGFSAVILLDCAELQSRDSLRASEDAIRVWSNAVALMARGGQAIAVGLSGIVGLKFSQWKQAEISAHELKQRRELRFPPAVRMASLSGERNLLDQILGELDGKPGIEILGPMPTPSASANSDWRALLRYEYGQGADLASLLKAQVLQSTAGHRRVSAKSGRAMRPIKINMDDTEVI
jgi:primosomal protein N' (replication factor Y)